jgi:hypothetical protein
MPTEDCEAIYNTAKNAGDVLQVIPNGMWPVAISGEVKRHGQSLGTLPIVRIFLCPATVTVDRTEFPMGVILLNDYPEPNNMTTYDFRYVENASATQQVFLMNNAGWPFCNKVVLWQK